MFRNNTDFPAQLTARLREAYAEYVRLRRDAAAGGDQGRLAAVLKYYQYLTHTYMGLVRGPAHLSTGLATSAAAAAQPDHTLPTQEPWLGQIRAGRKTVEGRPAPPAKYAGWVGALVNFGRAPPVYGRVTAVRHYPTLAAYLAAEWEQAAPEAGSAEEAAALYAAIRGKNGSVFSPEAVERAGGIAAIELRLELPAPPPDPDGARGLLVYHLMGLGKTFDAMAVALTAIGATDTELGATGHRAELPQTPHRRVLFVASKSLHNNFSKALRRYLDLFYGSDPAQAARKQAAHALARRAVTFVTMNAHNMADQVLRATSVGNLADAKRGDTERLGALDGLLVIVDEAHDFFRAIINSPQPSTNARRLYTMIMQARNLKLMFLTGTPSSKHPFELVPCFNMLAGREILPTQYDNFERHFVDLANNRLKNTAVFGNRIVGMVSYAGYDVPDELPAAATGGGAVGGEETAASRTVPRPADPLRRELSGYFRKRFAARQPPALRRRAQQLFDEALLAAAPGPRAARLRELRALLPVAEAQKQVAGTGRLGKRGSAARELLGDRAAGAAYLDVGSGDGSVAGAVGAALGVGSTTCVDVLPAPARTACDRYFRLNAGAGDLPPPPAGADGYGLTTLYMALHHISRPAAALKAVWERTAPGGYLLVREHDLPAGDAGAYLDWIHVMWNVAEQAADATAEPAAVDTRYRSFQEWVDLARLAGFELLAVAPPLDVPVDRAGQWARLGLFQKPPCRRPRYDLEEARKAAEGLPAVALPAADLAPALEGRPAADAGPGGEAGANWLPIVGRKPGGAYVVYDGLARLAELAAGRARAEVRLVDAETAASFTVGPPCAGGLAPACRDYRHSVGPVEDPARVDSMRGAYRAPADLPAGTSVTVFTPRDTFIAHALVRPGDSSVVPGLEPPAGHRWLEEVFVAPSWRGFGWGRLVVSLAEEAADAPLAALSAPGAEEFYERLGFERAGAKGGYVLLMRAAEKLGSLMGGGASKLGELMGAPGPAPTVRIHPLGGADAAALRRLASIAADPRVEKTLGPGEWSPAGFEALAEADRRGRAQHWYVTIGPDAEAVGYVGSSPAPPPHAGDIQLRCFVEPARWRQGVATRALQQAADALSAAATVRLCAPPGAAALPALALKAGFVSDPAGAPGSYVYEGGAEFSFPTQLETIIEHVEMSEQQYRQYRIAREKESSEGRSAGGKGPGDAPARTPPPLALPGSEREGGATYYVRSRMFQNFAAPRALLPTSAVLDSPTITGLALDDLPDEAFTADTSPKAVRLLENVEKSPGPFLVYSQFVGLGGLGVIARFLDKAGYVRYRPPADQLAAARRAVKGGGAASDAVAELAAYFRMDAEMEKQVRAALVLRPAEVSHDALSSPDGLDPILYPTELKGRRLTLYTNLHLGQRKLFLSELLLFGRRLARADEEALVVYVGAASGVHLPLLHHYFPGLKLHLVDPAPFNRRVRGIPGVHLYSEFFDDAAARRWGDGGDLRELHGRPDFFISDIRQTPTEDLVAEDMAAQRRWCEIIKPLNASFLKVRFPYVASGVQDYLDGALYRQCYPPKNSTEARLLVPGTGDAPLGERRYDLQVYDRAFALHNSVVRPFLRYRDRPELAKKVKGYDGRWDVRAEADLWETYLALPGSRRVSVAQAMNSLSGCCKSLKAEQACQRLRPGCLAGHYPGVYGDQLVARLMEAVKTRPVTDMPPGMGAAQEPLAVPPVLAEALAEYPAGRGWLPGILEAAMAHRPFHPDTDLSIRCPPVDSPDRRHAPKPAPRRIPLVLMGLPRPRRSQAVGLVHFLAAHLDAGHCARPADAPAATLQVPRAVPDARWLADYLPALFPGLRLEFVGERPGSEPPERLRYGLTVGGEPVAVLHYHADSTICESCQAAGGVVGGPAHFGPGTAGVWACWPSWHALGAHFHACPAKPAGPAPDGPADAPLTDATQALVAAHLVYDCSWTRYQVPVSRSLGDQRFETVEGYDGCWSCTAEAHTWLRYLRWRAAGSWPEPLPTGADCMGALTAACGEPLLDPASSSAHGRFPDRPAAAAIRDAVNVIRRSEAIALRGRRGGAEPPSVRRYAVITGEVGDVEQEAIRRTWVSPENANGELIYGLLASKTAAQGFDLKFGRQVHIFEPYWDKSLEAQVIARFIRIGALDNLPEADRTVQPYLYIATPNQKVISALAPAALEVPVMAAAQLERGATVDMAFHQRGLNRLALNQSARDFLCQVSIERALYAAAAPGSGCGPARICQPTNAPLFHISDSGGGIEEDLRLPDPCEVVTESRLEARSLVVPGEDVVYKYVSTPGVGLGYRFFTPAGLGGASAAQAVASAAFGAEYVEVDPSTPLYARLLSELEGPADLFG